MSHKKNGGIVFGFILLALFFGCTINRIEHTEVKTPSPGNLEKLLDDDVYDYRLSPKFDPTLVDSRPYNAPDGVWDVNSSAAVFRLDIASKCSIPNS